MLEQRIAQVLQRHTAVICERIKARWGNMSAIVGQEEIHSNLPVIVGSAVIATIEASGMAAFIKEFGSGHLLDEHSPYFDDYKASPMWNPARANDGNEFIGRSKGETVYRPDGTTYESTGKAEGLRLEHDIGKSGKYPAYKAFQGQHVIQEEITLAIPDIEADLQSAVNDYVLSMLTMDIQIYI